MNIHIALRWVMLPIIFFGLSFLFLLLSNMFFQWILPLDTTKDWIIFVITIPISGLLLMSQALAAIFSTQILPDDKQRLASKILFWFILLSILSSLALTRFSINNRGDLINLIQALLAIFITYNGTKRD